VIFIFGLGNVGRSFGDIMEAAGWSVRGKIRHPDKFTAKRGVGWKIIRFLTKKISNPVRAVILDCGAIKPELGVNVLCPY